METIGTNNIGVGTKWSKYSFLELCNVSLVLFL